MNLASAALWGLVATLAMTVLMTGGQRLGWSRMSIPFLWGTFLTADRDRAMVAGTLLHLVSGMIIAALYALIFESLSEASAWLGALLGLAHAMVILVVILPLVPGLHPRMARPSEGPRAVAMLEPPGTLGLNYGRATAGIAIVSHIIYGLILGFGYDLG